MPRPSNPPRQQRPEQGSQAIELVKQTQWNPTEIAVIKTTVAPGISDADLLVFDRVCKHTGLDPFSKQIYAIVRKGRMTIQTGIDGYRLIAQRTGQYAGQVPAMWCGDDGVWKDVWLPKDPPRAAKVGVLRVGHSVPMTAIALWDEYVVMDDVWEEERGERRRTGERVVSSMWAKMPANQLAKCAEAKALRMAFPAEMAGVYTTDEMAQAGGAPSAVDPAFDLAMRRLRQLAPDIKAKAREWAKGAGLAGLAEGKLVIDEIKTRLNDVVAWLDEHEVVEPEMVGHEAPAAPAAAPADDENVQDAEVDFTELIADVQHAVSEWPQSKITEDQSRGGVVLRMAQAHPADTLDEMAKALEARYDCERVGEAVWLIRGGRAA